MERTFDQLNAEINKLIRTCYGKSYKSRESLNELKTAFEKLSNLRKGIILLYNGFPGDLSVAGIVEDISKLLSVGRDKNLLEWSFDHYSDLFKFRADDLLADIALFAAKQPLSKGKI